MKIYPAILLLVFCSILITHVTANCVVEKQGDVVYLGEYCDISKVLGWQNQFAWWASGEPEGNPQRVVTVNGFMYNHYIDPSKYTVGTWYKWEGYIERAGNSLAFEVKAGKREAPNVTSSQPLNATVNGTETPAPLERTHPKDTDILIARGDEGVISYEPDLDINISGATDQKGFIWFFGGSDTKILGVPMNYSSQYGINSYVFSPNDTEHYTTGEYKGYIQFVGKNGKQDVFYDKENNTLDSPYKKVGAMPIDGLQPFMINSLFAGMANKSEFCDDYLVPITMTVMDPSVTIQEYWEEYDDIVIEGVTTLSNGTSLHVQVDPDHYALTKEILENTYPTQTYGKVDELRKFIISIPLKWGEMSVGHHKKTVSVDKYKIKTSMDKDFDVTGVWVNPTPTMVFRKVIVDEYGVHVVDELGRAINTSNNMSTPVPTTAKVTVVKTTITPPVISHPTTPTPIATPIPTTTDDVVVPLPPELGVLALIIVAVIVIRKK
jgi:hypothetical protein